MKTVFSLIFIFQSISTSACELSQRVVSLSGPITMIFEELNLLEDKNLLAVSVFHPIKKKFNGDVLAGGLFLPKKTIKKFKSDLIFYDKSKEFKSMLKKSGVIKTSELNTRGLNPFQAFELSLKKINPILNNCAERIITLKNKIKHIKKNLKLTNDLHRSVFFLGHIENKLPDTIISNDGFVLSLKNNVDFKTYPSELSYVLWSKKIMNGLKKYLLFGLKDGDSDKLEIKYLKKNKYNLSMRGVLTPGIRQIYFLSEFQKIKLK